MKGEFLTPLVTRHISAGRKELECPLIYRGSNGTVYTVPAGFFSDGASVPRFLWALYPAFGEAYEPAAWLHDYLYAYAELEFGTDSDDMISRAEADGLFAEAIDATGFRGSGRFVIFNSVRLGGWKPWRKYRRDAKKRAAKQEA